MAADYPQAIKLTRLLGFAVEQPEPSALMVRSIVVAMWFRCVRLRNYLRGDLSL